MADDEEKRTGSTGYRIPVTVRTDDSQKSTRFDGWTWFEQAADDDVRDLHAAGYRGDEADQLAHHAHEREKHTGVAQVFAYLTQWKPKKPSGAIVGFEVRLKADDVRRYLADRRPHLAAELFPAEPC